MLAGDLAAARQSFERALAVQPNSGPAYSYLGSLFDKEGQAERAIDMFERALAINPWDVVSLHNLGLAYLKNHQLDAAIARFKQAIQLAPEHAAAHSDLAYSKASTT